VDLNPRHPEPAIMSMGNDDDDDELLEVSNIPSELRSADLRAFFSEWVEGSKFRVFHYAHRPCGGADGSSAPDRKPARCCLVKVRRSDGDALIARYSGQRWRRSTAAGDEVELAERCCVSRAQAAPPAAEVAATSKEGAAGEPYLTRKQKRLERRKGVVQTRGTVVLKDLLPPPALPQGNVGTPSRTLIHLVGECIVPAVALKGLGVKLSGCGRTKERRGEFNFDWTFVGGTGDDSEEWERFEALEGPVPTHINERADRLECEASLFEEECEKTWEKGSSGLVLHTDDAHWDALRGDFHERTADALDVMPEDNDAHCDWEASTQDPFAVAFEEQVAHRKEALPGRIEYSGRPPAKTMLPPALRPKRKITGNCGLQDSLAAAVAGVAGDVPRSKKGGEDDAAGVVAFSIGGRSGCEDSFDRDVRKGFAGKLMTEKMGWRPGDGLGAKGDMGIVRGLVTSWGRTGGAGMPVKSKKDARRGIGFGARENDDSEDTGGDSDAERALEERIKPANAARGRDRNQGFSPPVSRCGGEAASAVESEDDYLRVGCIYDKDAMALRRMQEERASESWRPWLGSFCMSSMQEAGQVASCTRVPWWEEGETSGDSGGAKRRRLMKGQLETCVFKRAGELRPMHSGT
jgi:hypothetical protein